MGDRMASAIERFWASVDKDVGAPCWIWTGPKFAQGYGRFCLRSRSLKAHRFSWEMHHGKPVPHGLVICHSCDNKQCVNPEHLRAETQAFNVREAIERERWKPNFGAINGRTILTHESVREIRASSETQILLAKRYGVSQTHISRIKRGESYNYL
jgi:hypothetical protein